MLTPELPPIEYTLSPEWRGMTTHEAETIRAAIYGIDDAYRLLELDLRRVQRAIDNGIQIDLIGALNRIAMKEDYR